MSSKKLIEDLISGKSIKTLGANSLTPNEFDKLRNAIRELRSLAQKKYFQIIGEMPILAYINEEYGGFDPMPWLQFWDTSTLS